LLGGLNRKNNKVALFRLIIFYSKKQAFLDLKFIRHLYDSNHTDPYKTNGRIAMMPVLRLTHQKSKSAPGFGLAEYGLPAALMLVISFTVLGQSS
jgi:hypothetical protein